MASAEQSPEPVSESDAPAAASPAAASPVEETSPDESWRAYGVAALVAGLLAALPFFLVQFPPATDLPQQVAQVRLLAETLAEGDASPYRVQWLAPNKLGVVPLALASWWTDDPIAPGRLGLVLIALAWAAALAAVARSHRRGAWTVLAAMLFFFSHALSWGLLNHLTGLPVFLLWWLSIERLGRDGRRTPLAPLVQLGVVALGLYLAHILWLAAGLLTLGVMALATRWPSRRLVLTLLAVSPTIALVAWWYPTLVVGGFDSVTAWGGSPLFRLHPGWLVNSALGGLKGSLESWLLAALIAWCGLGLWQHRRRLRTDSSVVDRRLLTVGLGFLVAALLLPNVFSRTVFFASRWLPVAAVFLVLSLPAPQLAPRLRTLVAGLLLAGLTISTATAWQQHEAEELAGLPEALAALPEAPRLLGLDFARVSTQVQGYPFYHLYVWGQVLRGGEVARSFANEASSLVVYRDIPRQLPWTEGLDWAAHKVRRSDIPHFDHVLVHGPPDALGQLLSDPRLTPVTPPNRWTLLRVGVAPAPLAPAAPQSTAPTPSQPPTTPDPSPSGEPS